MSVLRRGKQVVAGDLLYAAEDDEFQKRLPALFEFLSLSRWDDGAARQTGTGLIFAQDGVFKLWLNDRDVERSAFVSCPLFLGLLGVADEALAADLVKWRAVAPTRSRKS